MLFPNTARSYPLSSLTTCMQFLYYSYWFSESSPVFSLLMTRTLLLVESYPDTFPLFFDDFMGFYQIPEHIPSSFIIITQSRRFYHHFTVIIGVTLKENSKGAFSIELLIETGR